MNKKRDRAASPIVIEISWRTFLVAAGICFAAWLVYTIADFLVLLFACIVFAAALAPFARSLEQRGLPRWAAVTLIYLVLFLFMGAVLVLIVPTFSQQVSQLVATWPERSATFRESIGQNQSLKGIFDSVTTSGASGGDIVKNIVNITSLFVNGFATTIIFLVLTFYLLMNGRKLARFLVGFVPTNNRERIGTLIARMSNRMGFWFRGQVIIAIMTFLVTWLVLSLMGVEFALTLALIAGMAEFIPLIGSWIGAAPAVLVAAGQSPMLAVFTALYFLIWQTFQGYIISPRVMQQMIGVPSILILINVLLMAKLFGFVGVFLAAPVAAAIAVIVEEYSDRVQHSLRQGLARAGQRDS